MSRRARRFFGIRGVGSFGVLLMGWLAGSLSAALAVPSGYAPHGIVTVDGVTVPDIGPMPTQVPIPRRQI